MPVSIRGQFQRSVHLVRDFHGSRSLDGYVVTSKAVETTARIADGLASPGSYRAWSISGPYGGGKSSYALFVSRLLRGDAGALALLAATDAGLAERLGEAGPLVPVLVVGSRGPITRALAEGLAQALDVFAATLPEAGTEIARQAEALASKARGAATEPEVVGVYGRAADLVRQRTGGGLLVVVDELGKHLEYAALHPGDGDPFVLQSLAERTGAPGAAPIALLTVLHQAFERYAVGLSTEQRKAWVKIQGRFEEVAFVEPVGETLRLLASAIDADLPDEVVAEGAQAVTAVLASASVGRLDPEAVADRLRAALPLHPAVALLVGPLFRRLAQNERSLFSFLASGEPRSFLDVVGQEPGLYRLDHLYDYLTSSLGGALYHGGAGRLWAEAETALSRAAGDALQERVLKQVAVLSFAGTLAGLPPSEGVLSASTGATETETQAALDALRQSRAVTFRPHHREYRVWEGSDFDVSAALAEARSEIPLRSTLAGLLARAAPPSPVVARRHAFETGTSRAFDVVYADHDGWRRPLDAPLDPADGRIVYVLPEREDPDLVDEIIRATEGGAGLHLVCVLPSAAGLADLARDLAALDWVRQNATALEGDKAARREVDEQRADLRAALDHRLAAAVAPSAGTWVRAGETFSVEDDGLQARLSDVCDQVFHRTPRIRSELLNRRRPSSSAVRALKLLLQAMAERQDQPRLGIPGTPAEYALYVTVLESTGLHRQRDGEWAFADADDDGVDPGSAAVVAALAEAIGRARDAPVAVPDLYETVRAAPYGVREGLLPVFLTVVLLRLGDDVALFEDGVYQWSLSYEAVERLLRVPGSFAVQSVGASPAQRAAIGALAPRVGLPEGSAPKPLPVVGRILQAISGLPVYVRRTQSLSEPAVEVREALVHATEPAALLFRELPLAVGVEPFGDGAVTEAVEARAGAFGDRLSDALRELGAAYDDLLSDLDAALAAAFDLRERTPDARRDELAGRARALRDDRADPSVRSFVVRAADDLADTRAWTESLAALLARTPPAQWSDADRQRFEAGLDEVAQAFRGREAVSLSAADPAGGARSATKFRLRVTSTHQEERDTLVTVHAEDRDAVRDAARDLAAFLDASGRSLDTQLAALSQLSLALIQRRAGGDATLEDLLAALNSDDD